MRKAHKWQARDDYDGNDDFAKSIEEGLRAIRERMAKGGPGWTPKEPRK